MATPKERKFIMRMFLTVMAVLAGIAVVACLLLKNGLQRGRSFFTRVLFSVAGLLILYEAGILIYFVIKNHK